MDAPDDLRTRGLQFWDEVSSSEELDASGFVLLGEACRIIDRLDRLSAALNGKGRDWLKLADDIEVIASRDGSTKINVKVAVDGILSEARQQQLAFKSVMAQMGLGKASEKQTSENKSALEKWLEAKASGG